MSLMSLRATARNSAPAWRPAASSIQCRVHTWLMLVACILMLHGCAGVGTSVEKVWQDDSRVGAALDRTLVLVLLSQADIAARLENEWVRQLRERGIDAYPAHPLLAGDMSPSKQQVVELVKTGRFDTLLLTNVLDVKRVQREIPSYQVAVIETSLYDAKTEDRFWWARSDSFLVNPTGDRIIQQMDARVEEFVRTLLAEMSRSKLL